MLKKDEIQKQFQILTESLRGLSHRERLVMIREANKIKTSEDLARLLEQTLRENIELKRDLEEFTETFDRFVKQGVKIALDRRTQKKIEEVRKKIQEA